jgi:membrane-associated protease RseP (regulator of RpoE activity)
LNMTLIFTLTMVIVWTALWLIYKNKSEKIIIYPLFFMIRLPLTLMPKRSRKLSKAAWLGVALLIVSFILFYYDLFEVVYFRYLKPIPGSSRIGFAPLIPGITIPWSILPHVLVALGIAALFHELSHALVARMEGLKIKSAGFLLFAFIPAAFVEVDENEIKRAKISSKLKVYSAGVGANVLLFLFFMLIMLGGCSYLSSGVKVVDVAHPSLAETSGIQKGDVIIRVNGIEVKCIQDLSALLKKLGVTDPNKEISLTLKILRNGKEVLVNIRKPKGVSRLGIAIVNNFNNLGYIVYFSEILNYALALINAAPLFITDGAKVLDELLMTRFKEETGRVLSLGIQFATLLLVLSVLTIAPIVPG